MHCLVSVKVQSPTTPPHFLLFFTRLSFQLAEDSYASLNRAGVLGTLSSFNIFLHSQWPLCFLLTVEMRRAWYQVQWGTVCRSFNAVEMSSTNTYKDFKFLVPGLEMESYAKGVCQHLMILFSLSVCDISWWHARRGSFLSQNWLYFVPYV